MKMNRRNVLVGLGAIVGSGGIALGTGAFTSVSAERTVSVSTAGDDSALLALSGDGEYVSQDGSSGTLTIDLGSLSNGFNDDAITKITDVVTITNNAPSSADNSSTTVGLSTSSPGNVSGSGSGSVTVTVSDGNSGFADVTFYLDDASGDSFNSTGSTAGLSSGGSAYLDVKIDTTIDDSNATADNTLTIVASGSSA